MRRYPQRLIVAAALVLRRCSRAFHFEPERTDESGPRIRDASGFAFFPQPTFAPAAPSVVEPSSSPQ
jgi:hypothetical protein